MIDGTKESLLQVVAATAVSEEGRHLVFRLAETGFGRRRGAEQLVCWSVSNY
jgi:hypothetical protein